MKRTGATARSSHIAAKGAVSLRSAGSRTDLLTLTLLALAVALIVLVVHWPVLSAQAASFDDEEAIVHNTLVQNPSMESVRRFFSEVLLSSVVRGYYRPLTLTSLMLDWVMGARPDNLQVFHRTSLALHIGSTVLIILLCYQVFHQPIVAALVGLLFGVHPLTVEPIAWVMERKTLLAALFAFGTLNAYVRYTQKRSPGWFVIAIVTFLLSLLSKPTGTPLPIIMLLMDYWPLGRLRRRALIEKTPFFALSLLFAILACVCEERVNPLTIPATTSPLHLPLRLCWLIVFYPCKILLPMHLSSVYMMPQPMDLTNMVVLLSVAGTMAIVTALVISRRWTPALWTGATMFYIGLAPTMGFVGYSWVVASDKYAYLPAVGLVLTLGWLLQRVWSGGTQPGHVSRQVGTVLVVLAVAGLFVAGTRRYLSRWQTTESLCDYMLGLAPDAYQVYLQRADFRGREGNHDLAIHDYDKIVELKPDFAEAYNNRGLEYAAMGENERAIADYSRAIEIDPTFVPAYSNRGGAWIRANNFHQAIKDSPERSSSTRHACLRTVTGAAPMSASANSRWPCAIAPRPSS